MFGIIFFHIKISKYTLNKEKLKAKYKQIVGFYFVSCTKLTGIDVLADDIVKVTLGLKYIGENIPVINSLYYNLTFLT